LSLSEWQNKLKYFHKKSFLQASLSLRSLSEWNTLHCPSPLDLSSSLCIMKPKFLKFNKDRKKLISDEEKKLFFLNFWHRISQNCEGQNVLMKKGEVVVGVGVDLDRFCHIEQDAESQSN
jgi:hypothetical protein